jgi:galactose-1-phosphate uridylyltransferase
MRSQLEGANRYFRDNGKEFWEDFIQEEKKRAERFLGEIGGTSWSMGFAPRSHIPDVWCIFPKEKSLLRLRKGPLDCFLEGLSAVLYYYHGLGLFSFNVSLFSFRQEEHFRVNARIQPRLLLREIGNSDHTFLQAVHEEYTSIRPPEAVCRDILGKGASPFTGVTG